MIELILFDLDNTLHDFVSSSKKALNKIFISLHKEYAVGINELKGEYSRIVKIDEEEGFATGRSSNEYRTNRFSKLLSKYNIGSSHLVKKIVDMYSDELNRNLKPFPGVVKLLNKLFTDFELGIYTEGPYDAQINTLKRIGVYRYFKYYFISGKTGYKKKDGSLLQHVLDELKIPKNSILLIGDSYESDFLPARKKGVKAVLFSKRKNTYPSSFNSCKSLYEHIKKIAGK